MNKTVSVNIGGFSHKIDEEAYSKLQRYLDAIKMRFVDEKEQTEIMHDIENRIAEIFSERFANERDVVNSGDVDYMIGIMGEPNDIGEENAQESTYTKTASNARRLFRDPDDRLLGGIASGISAYFGIKDPLWMRLLLIVSVFLGFGLSIPIYILLWIIVPEAQTTAEKLQMKGEEANVSNIEKSIKDEIEKVKESLDNIGTKKKLETFLKD